MDFARLSPYVRDLTKRLEQTGVEAAKLGELINDYADHLVEALEEIATALENEDNERSESAQPGGTDINIPLEDMYRYLCSRNNYLYSNALIKEILFDTPDLMREHYQMTRSRERAEGV